jgi:predicted ArsR family transcriptional regulator
MKPIDERVLRKVKEDGPLCINRIGASVRVYQGRVITRLAIRRSLSRLEAAGKVYLYRELETGGRPATMAIATDRA